MWPNDPKLSHAEPVMSTAKTPSTPTAIDLRGMAVEVESGDTVEGVLTIKRSVPSILFKLEFILFARFNF
jgi:hypothetical protein